MSVLYTDIRDRIGAGRYYSLAIEPLAEWDEDLTYQIGDRVNACNDNYSGFGTITTAYRALTVNTDSNPSENLTDWEEYSLAVEGVLTRAVRKVKAFCKNRNHTFVEDNEEETEAVILWAIAYLIDYSNQMSNTNSDDSASMDEKEEAKEYLNDAFQFKDEDTPKQAPFSYVSTTNPVARTLSETDTEDYYNKDYYSRDLDR